MRRIKSLDSVFKHQIGSISLAILFGAYIVIYYTTGFLNIDSFATIGALMAALFSLRAFGNEIRQGFYKKRILGYVMLIGFHAFCWRELYYGGIVDFLVAPDFLKIYATAIAALFGIQRLNLTSRGLGRSLGTLLGRKNDSEGTSPQPVLAPPAEDYNEPTGVEKLELIELAEKELGVKEIQGSQHNPRIIEYGKIADIEGYGADEIPWCAVFVNAMCELAGIERSYSAVAKSFLKVGEEVSAKEVLKDPSNTVAIFHRGNSSRDWRGHVAIVESVDKSLNFCTCIGGNQNNEVTRRTFDISGWRFAGFRKLEYL